MFADYVADAPGFTASLVAPASLSLVASGDANAAGSLVVADPGAQSVVTIGRSGSAAVFLPASQLGLAGRKRLSSVRCVLAAVPGSVVALSYSIDGGVSLTPKSSFSVGESAVAGFVSETIAFPPDTIGRKVAYSLSLQAAGTALAPEVLSLKTTYRRWTAKPSGKGGGGASGNRRNSNGTASGNSASAGGGSGSGGGVGGGTGSGSGQGAGSGSGSGSTNSNGADTGAAAGTTGATLPAAVAGAAPPSGAAARTVSGYAFKVSGRAGGGEGGGSSPAGAGLPVLPALGGAAGVAALLLVGPWGARRRLRLFTGWDEDAQRPFPAERTTDMPQRFSVPGPLGRWRRLPK